MQLRWTEEAANDVQRISDCLLKSAEAGIKSVGIVRSFSTLLAFWHVVRKLMDPLVRQAEEFGGVARAHLEAPTT